MIFIPKKSLITAGQSFSVTGGTVTTDGGDNIHTFTSDGTLTVTGTVDIDVFLADLELGGGVVHVHISTSICGQMLGISEISFCSFSELVVPLERRKPPSALRVASACLVPPMVAGITGSARGGTRDR